MISNILIPSNLLLKSDRLNILGKELCNSNDKNILDKINKIINKSLGFNKGYSKDNFKSLVDYKLNSRYNNV